MEEDLHMEHGPYTGMSTDVEQELGRVYAWGIIPELLGMMPSLRSVVLCGKTYAWTLEDQIRSLRPEVEVLTAPHPSPKGLIPKWGLTRQELIDWIRDEMKAAREYVLAASPVPLGT
jgi:hypothetical protein